jgi:hypothetical protein
VVGQFQIEYITLALNTSTYYVLIHLLLRQRERGNTRLMYAIRKINSYPMAGNLFPQTEAVTGCCMIDGVFGLLRVVTVKASTLALS